MDLSKLQKAFKNAKSIYCVPQAQDSGLGAMGLLFDNYEEIAEALSAYNQLFAKVKPIDLSIEVTLLSETAANICMKSTEIGEIFSILNIKWANILDFANSLTGNGYVFAIYRSIDNERPSMVVSDAKKPNFIGIASFELV
jgi:hypothetical protein